METLGCDSADYNNSDDKKRRIYECIKQQILIDRFAKIINVRTIIWFL